MSIEDTGTAAIPTGSTFQPGRFYPNLATIDIYAIGEIAVPGMAPGITKYGIQRSIITDERDSSTVSYRYTDDSIYATLPSLGSSLTAGYVLVFLIYL